MNLNDLRLKVGAVLILVLVTTLVVASKGPGELDAQVTSAIPSDRQILISNLQGSSAGTDALLLVSSASSAVEIFAGVDADGLDDTSKWMLESVVLRFNAPAAGITVSLWSTDESGTVNVPNALLTTFTSPTVPSGSMNSYLRFTLSTPYELDQDTGYWIVVNATSRTANSPYIATTTNEDSGGANSWDIGDSLIFRSTSTAAWQAHPTSLGLQVQAEGHFAPGVVIQGDDSLFTDYDDQSSLFVEGGEEEEFFYTVKLRSRPSGDVTITPTSPAELTITPSSRTFTTNNWETPQRFTVNPIEDDDLEDNSYTVTHSVSGYGSITSGPSIDIDIKDNSTASVTLSSNTLAVNEGAMDTYSFVLDKQPRNDVTITPTVPSNSNVTVSPTSLTFTSSNWNVAQEFTVTAAEDANSTNETVTITHAVTEPDFFGSYLLDDGLTYHAIEASDEFDFDLVVTINDNDIITLNKSSLTVAEGGTGDYTVVLAQQPTATVTVTLTLSSGIGVTTMPSGTLTFTTTDWNTAQTVTVTGTQDADGFNNTGTITHTVSGGGLNGSARLDTTVTDDEEVGIVLAGSAMRNTADDAYEMTVTEGTSSGSSNQYTVKLASQPHPSSTDVTVDITASGSLTVKKMGETTGSAMATLTFTGTNWNTAQTVTLEAGQDADSADEETTISHVAKGANYQGHANNTENLNVTITDDDSPGIRPSVTTLAITETDAAVTGMFTVRLDTQPSADVTVTLGQPTNTDVTVDTDSVMVDNQTDLTFTSTNWSTVQTVTVSVAHDATADDEMATITLNASQSGGDMEYDGVTERTVTVTVTDDETPGVRGISNATTLTENADMSVSGGPTFVVRLGSEPTSPVTITTTVVGVTPAVVAGNSWTNPDVTATSSITLNSTNYASGASIVVGHTRDTDAENDVARIDYTVSQTGGAMEYDGFSIPSTTVNITDNEVAVVQFKASGETAWHAVNPNLTVTDAAGITIPTISTDLATLDVTASFDARLSHQPRADVTVTMTTTTDQKTIFNAMTNTRGRPQTVAKTFAASSWSLTNTETFEVKVRSDQDSYGESYTLDFSVSGYGEGTAADQTLRVVDEDPVGWAAHTTTTFEVNEAEPSQIAEWTVTPLSNPSTHNGGDANVQVELEYSIANKLRDGQSSFVLIGSDVWSDGLDLSVRAVHDADSANEEVTVRHVVTSQSGGMNGDYHSTSIQDIVITIIDDDPPDLRFGSLDTGDTVIGTEPASGTNQKRFSFSLATVPRDEVTVEVSEDIDNASISRGSRETFNSSTNFGRWVHLDISPDDDTVDDSGSIMFTVTQPGGPMEYDGLAVTPIPVTITDPDRSAVELSTDTLTITEEGTGSYTVALSHQPAASDTLTVAIAITGPSGSTLVTVDDDSLDFNATNWDTPQTVTITGVADANLTNETFTLTHTVTGTRAATGTPTLSVTRTDNDTANLDISQSSVTAVEGASGGGTFTMELTQQPSANVVLTVTAQGSGHDVSVTSGADCTSTSNSATFTFTSTTWDTAQTVRVCAAHDYDADDDDVDLRVTVASSDTNYSVLTARTIDVTVDDDDTEEITISETAVSISEVDGGVATQSYNVTLSAAPTGGNVVVNINSSNTDVTLNPSVLTFRPSDWTGAVATPSATKSVEIRVADDADANNDSALLTHAQSGTTYGTVTTLPQIDVTITDTDTHGVTVAADDPFEFTEGGSKTYTLVLDSQPTGPVTIGIDDGDATDDVTVDRSTVEFDVADWSTPKTVRVSAARDDDGSDDTATITHTVSGADYTTNAVTADSIAVTVLDPDVQGVILRVGGVEGPTDPAFAIGEGFGTVEYALKLATAPVGGDVTVTVATTNTAELVIVDPGTGLNVTSRDVTFTATNWDDFQTVTVTAPQEDADTQTEIVMITHTVSGADYASVTADSIDVTINDDDDPSFSPAVETLDITEGSTSSYTVVLDNVPVGGNVTMTISAEGNADLKLRDSNDNEVNQITLTFTSTDFSTPQTVTVSAVEDDDALMDTGRLRHSVTGANFTGAVDDIVMPVSIEDVTEAGVTIDPMSLSITEGRSGRYAVVLQSEPQENVTIVPSSSDPRAVTITPNSLTFTNTNWNQAQRIQVTGVRDSLTVNRATIISHTSSGDLYDDLMIPNVGVMVIDDGTAIRDNSSFLQRSSCDGEVRLTWNSPTEDNVSVDSYRIQWRTADQQFSTTRSVSAPADATSYTLTSLMNGVMYTIRVHGLDAQGVAVWSRESTATPSTQSCIAAVSFGNILADSTPVIVAVDEMAEGTTVNMRYRSLNPGEWSEVMSKVVEPGENMVVFDIRGLTPENLYEVQTWLGSMRPPIDDRSDMTTAVAQTIFQTTTLPEGVTYVPGGGGGGSVARISRIEPAITSVTMSVGDRVLLSVEVWGRQGIRDNELADRAPSDGRPQIVWSVDGSGTFEESVRRADWRDGVANDRAVIYVAPTEPDSYTVTASLADSVDCLSRQVDDEETSEEHVARCSAQFEVRVVRRVTVPEIRTVPVNPPGVLPETLTDNDGVAYAVFTPVDGGSFAGDGYSLVADAGAVADGEYIGIAMHRGSDASNEGKTWHRYTLGGALYSISVVDASGDAVSDYLLGEAATVCVPLPAELRGNIADIVLIATVDDAQLTVLSSSVKITPEGISVCGMLSSLPADVAVGKSGSPAEADDETGGAGDGAEIPDTGGRSIVAAWAMWMLVAGAAGVVAGVGLLGLMRTRR